MDLKCQFEDCGLILENPVRLLCGNNVCREHLDEFETKFKCQFCHKQHSVLEDGFLVNEEIEQKINSFYQSDPLRKEAKESYNKLNEIINNYDEINDPDGYISNYIGEIRERVVPHRDEMVEEIHDKSKEMIKQLEDKNEKCKSNSSKIEKMNIEKANLKQNEKNDLLIREVRDKDKKYKNALLMNEVIYFEKYEKSSSFGKLSFYSYEKKIVSE